VREVDVICPGFVVDCLETLEEISIEAKSAFLKAGGHTFRYIPCLNEAPVFIDALASLVESHLAGWPTSAQVVGQAVQDGTLSDRRARALALGALS
jgi:ferrochelatase